MNLIKPNSVPKYIQSSPKNVRLILKKIRSTIKKAAPKANEGISYGMPGYKLNKRPLVYFAAFKHHIGFYALPSGNKAFKKELSGYKTGRGSIQFPLDKPVPYGLVGKIVKFRVGEVE